MSARRIGAILLSLAGQVCQPDTVEAVALPIIADMQFEAEASAHRSLLTRAWVRGNGYLVFFKAIALTVLLGQGRNPMKSAAFGWLRLLLAIPIALLVTAGVQLAATRFFGMMLVHQNGHVLEGVTSVKIVSSPFMAAALFWTLYLIAPPHRRSPVAVGALIVTGLWGGLMMFGALAPWPAFHGWLFGIGIALWLGGGVSYWLARRLRAGLPASA
jgi:hypothetical protein